MSASASGGGHPYRDPADCDHGIQFPPDDEYRAATKGMAVAEIRKKWPRLSGACPLSCGYIGIYYASYLHYLAGDW